MRRSRTATCRSGSCSPPTRRSPVSRRVPATSDDEFSGAVAGELQLLDPGVRARPELTAELLHDDFTEFGASGRVWDKPSIVAAMAADPGAGAAAQAMRGITLGPDVVLLTYRLDGVERPSLRSSVWVRAEGRWVLLFHQGTPTSPSD